MNKKKLGLTGTIATLAMGWGGYQWLNENYTPLAIHEALASEVSVMKLEQSYRATLDEYYYQKNLSRKYPADPEIKERLKQLEEEKTALKKAIDNKSHQ